MENKLSVNKERFTNFWLLAGLLAILLATSLSRDIFRPFYGLHSWAEAHSPWGARVHAKYGLGYTKGFSVRAVGANLKEKPYRYLDHPQLGALVNAATMKVLGINEWALRVTNIIATLITLLLFLRIMRGLVDDITALLAGLIFCMFPLIGYFGVNLWLYPFALWGLWNYLVVIRAVKDGPEPKTMHRVLLAICLFIGLQFSWEGFFFALGIGVHYVAGCVFKKRWPDWGLLLILFFAPVISIMVDFLIMAAGHNWNFETIYSLFKWRAGSGEMQEHKWGPWFAKFGEHSITNFTKPVLTIAVAYLTVGQLLVFMQPKAEKTGNSRARQFPQFWLFLMIPVSQLFILKGALWPHQTWIRPFSFIIAIAAAQGIMLVGDVVGKANKRLAKSMVGLLIGIVFLYSIIGTNYYYGIRWQAPAKIKMLKTLNEIIPPDKALLSFEHFIVNQHKAKGAFYRPEIAWYLDRDVTQAQSLQEVQDYAKTGLYPYYLVPRVGQLQPLINQLNQQYKVYTYLPGQEGEKKNGKFFKAGMMDYIVFDLSEKNK